MSMLKTSFFVELFGEFENGDAFRESLLGYIVAAVEIVRKSGILS